MALNTRRTGSAEYGRFIKALVCGEPGSGKTLISSTFPNPYFASIEGGMMSIAERHLPYLEVGSSEEMFELKSYLELPPSARESMIGCKVDTIVIDTIDEYQGLLVRERLADQKRNSLTLQDYGWLAEQMKILIRALRNLDMNVVFTCHIKETRDDELGRIVYKPGMQGQIADQMAGFVDLSLLLTSHLKTEVVDNTARPVVKRALQTFPDAQHPWIKDRSGKLPTEVEVNFSDDYQRIYDHIFKGIDVGKTVDIVPANVMQQTAAPDPEPVVTPEDVAGFTAQVQADDEKGSTLKCESCGTNALDSDQAELSKLRVRKVLCNPCYKTEMQNRRNK